MSAMICTHNSSERKKPISRCAQADTNITGPKYMHTYRSARPCPTLYPSDSRRKNVVSLTSSSSGCLPSFVERSFASLSAIGTSSIRSRSRHEALRRWAWGSEGPKGEPGASNDIAADGGYADVPETCRGLNECAKEEYGVYSHSRNSDSLVGEVRGLFKLLGEKDN